MSNLTKFQKRALFDLAEWDHEYGGLGRANGRSAQALIKRGWVRPCVKVDSGWTGVMACEMRYVITTKGRKAATEFGWEPGTKYWLVE